MIDEQTVHEFLAGARIGVVGASDAKGSFGGTIYRALRDHGYDAVPINRTATEVAGDTAYRSVLDVPGDLDGVIVMTAAALAPSVVADCVDAGVARVWLFQGLGAPGAVSEDAVAMCRDHGIDVVAGACPLMFLEPVGWFHRTHRFLRRRNGTLVAAPHRAAA